jgi:hypothetical protein
LGFEELNNEFFKKMLDPVEHVLGVCAKLKSWIQQHLLVYFGGKELSKSSNPQMRW